MQLTRTVLLFLAIMPILAFARHDYYPAQYQQKFENSQLSGPELKQALFRILNEYHLRNSNAPDELGCSKSLMEKAQKNGRCYRQESLSYRYARTRLFGELHLEKDNSGDYYVKEVYCNKIITNRDTRIGRGQIPNHTIVNTEHSWPQSKFTGRFSRSMQKGDLHHLFPTNSRANSIRSSYHFSDVRGGSIDGCHSSAVGPAQHGSGQYFEPANEIKGNIARAIFYFSIRYQQSIPSTEEAALRRWHDQDPVDQEERERNDGIYEIQANRNPFIDYPELVDLIQDF